MTNGVKRRFEVSERAFKHLAFWSTLAGLVMMAAGLRALVFEGRFLLFVLLFAGGGAVASLSVVLAPRPEPGFSVEVLTREGCSLCDEAAAWLAAKAPEYDFTVWESDVDADPALAEEYGDWVPVGFIRAGAAKREVFRLKPDYPALEREFKRIADSRVRGRVREPRGRGSPP